MVLREGREADAKEILDIYSYYVLNTVISFELTPPSCEEMKKRLKESFPFFVAEVNGEIVGYALTHPFHEREAYKRSREITIYIKRGYTGRKIGSSLYKKIEEQLKDSPYHNLYALIAWPGTGSVEFHRKMGYKTVAFLKDCGFKFGKARSVVYMEKRL